MAFVESLPLPPKPTTYEIWQEDRPQYLSAYSLAFHAENYATRQADADPKAAQGNITSARVAGYLLVELFNRRAILTEDPCRQISKDLLSGDREGGSVNELVFKIGKMYRDRFIRLFRTTPTTYSSPSLHSSRPSFHTVEEMTKDCMDADGKGYQTVKRQALARDGYRCLLTGNFDMKSMQNNSELTEKCTDLGAVSSLVSACHILSESTMQGVDPAESSGDGHVMDKTDHATAAISILMCFGLEDLVFGLLAKNGIHRLGNLLSLDPTCHIYFDSLNLWFEPTEEPNRYQVCVSKPFFKAYLNLYGHLDSDHLEHLFVTFRRTNNSQEFPDPQLLSLHAACARVAHMSGAAEAFDEGECDVGDTRVLDLDGSSAHLLDHLLTPFEAAPWVA